MCGQLETFTLDIYPKVTVGRFWRLSGGKGSRKAVTDFRPLITRKNKKIRAIRLTYGWHHDLAIRRGALRTRFAFSSSSGARDRYEVSLASLRRPPSQQRGSEQ